MKCYHYFCRSLRAAELCAMGQTQSAVLLHREKSPVECKQLGDNHVHQNRRRDRRGHKLESEN